jgi:hypothetical protein
MMKPPESFALFCEGLHQDALIDVSSIGELAAHCLGHVPHGKHRELADFLNEALGSLQPSEIKGLINRQKTSVLLKSSAAADLFRSALAHIRTEV